MGRAIVLPTNRIAILIGAALFVGYSLGRLTTKSKSKSKTSKWRDNNGSSGAFVLIVNMKFTSLTHRDSFLELVGPVCKDVHANEGPSSASEGTETTLSYQVAISDKDPLMVLFMERYSDKDHGYLEVHRSGKEFLKFREKLKGMQERGDVVIEGESYLETDLGYV